MHVVELKFDDKVEALVGLNLLEQ
ncbi:hypothetical protein A2U01_0087303, partial [Trifolium medium]|nr:hypothetical protein [Trifolium medium]MCI66045.1 hypothetical protein [Trifolium medium]